jgi:hypothetical protein
MRRIGARQLAALRCAFAVILCLLAASCTASDKSADGWVVMLDLPRFGPTAVPLHRLGRAVATDSPRELVRLDERECRRLDIGGYYGSMSGAPIFDAQGRLRAIVQDGISIGLPCIVSLASEAELEQARNRCLFLGGGEPSRTEQDSNPWPVDEHGSVAAVGRVLLLRRSIGNGSTAPSASATVCWTEGARAVARIQSSVNRTGARSGTYAISPSKPVAFVDFGGTQKLLFESGPVVGRTICVVGDYALLSPEAPKGIQLHAALNETHSSERRASREFFADTGGWQESCKNALQAMLVDLDLRRAGSVRVRIEIDGSVVQELEIEASGAQRVSNMAAAELLECLRARTTSVLPEVIRVRVELLSDG